MKKLFAITILIAGLGAATPLFAQIPGQVYTKATDLTMAGEILPTKNPYHRVDTANYPGLSHVIKKLLTNGAGKMVCFSTNSKIISAKWCVTSTSQYANLTPINNKGLDLYIKKDGKWIFAGAAGPNAANLCSEAALVRNMDSTQKECLLYLPTYAEISNLEVGVEKNASLQPGSQPFAKRILIYGSSILQGAAASRAGMAYPARLCRETGLNFLNLGLSGNGKMEKEAADMVAAIPADAYILDCIPNPSPQQIHERANYLVKTIRAAHPAAPIIIIQTIIRETGNFDLKARQVVAAQNATILQEYELLKKQGVKDLYFIEGKDLIGKDHEGTVDGTHPNDLGFDRMIQILKPRIMHILKKYHIEAN